VARPDPDRDRDPDDSRYWVRIAAIAAALVTLLLYMPAVIDWYLRN
jgi:hypothetical protein